MASKSGTKSAGKADALQQKSPAEFFAENKNIAGFDNVSDTAHRHHDCNLTVLPCIRPARGRGLN